VIPPSLQVEDEEKVNKLDLFWRELSVRVARKTSKLKKLFRRPWNNFRWTLPSYPLKGYEVTGLHKSHNLG